MSVHRAIIRLRKCPTSCSHSRAMSALPPAAPLSASSAAAQSPPAIASEMAKSISLLESPAQSATVFRSIAAEWDQHWSSSEIASRIPPSASRAIISAASRSMEKPSCEAI